MSHPIHILGAIPEKLVAALPAYLHVLQIGVGKVNGSIAASRLLRSIPPQGGIVLIVGTAAAAHPDLKIGDVVLSTRTGYHDVDVTALGFAPGQIPFEKQWVWESDPDLREHAARVCEQLQIFSHSGGIFTGDQFISDPARVTWIHETFNAFAIEMETAAIVQTLARRPNVRWLGIHVISDLADKSAPVDFSTFLPEAAETIGRIVRELSRAHHQPLKERSMSNDTQSRPVLELGGEPTDAELDQPIAEDSELTPRQIAEALGASQIRRVVTAPRHLGDGVQIRTNPHGDNPDPLEE